MFGTHTALKYTPTYSGVKEDIILDSFMPDAKFEFLMDAAPLWENELLQSLVAKKSIYISRAGGSGGHASVIVGYNSRLDEENNISIYYTIYDPWPSGEHRNEWEVNITGTGQTYEGKYSWIINGNVGDCPHNHQLHGATLNAYILQDRSK